MTASLWKSSTTNAFSTTLNGSITNSDATITLTTVTGLVAPGVICIDRTDSSGTSTPNSREYITYTGIAGSSLTGCSRGVAGSSAQAHSSGALAEETFTVTHWGDLMDYLAVSHDSSGRLVSTSTATLTTTRILTHLNASGASISGNFPINPVWIGTANLSVATTSAGNILSMPQSGQWQWFSVSLRAPASGASLVIDVNKNGTSIFDTATRLMITGGGTYASTASIATKAFARGDFFNFDIDIGSGSSAGVTVQARGE